MPGYPQDTSLPLPCLDTALDRRAPSPLAEEVVDLFNELRNPLLRYVLSFGLAAPDGEEIVQEVFLALFLHLRKGKPRTNLRGWIFRVGHNLALKRRLREGRAARTRGDADSAPEPLDTTPNPEQHVTGAERQRLLLDAVRGLSEHDRSCLYLRAEGLRYREIAETLGVSLGGVALSLARSLGKLRASEGE